MSSTSITASNWSHYAEITSDNTKVDNANDNLLYDLSLLDTTFWNNIAQADGGDIRITNSAGDTAYSFELENFVNNGDGTGTGIIFFDSSILQTGSDTVWRLYCGNASASMPAPSDTLGSENVWNVNYEAVYHQENANDSTSNSNNGTSSGGMTVGGATGQIGNASSFDGNDDWITVPDSASLDITGSITFSTWVNISAITDYGGLINRGNERIWSNNTFAWALRYSNTGQLQGAVVLDGTFASVLGSTLSTSNWYYANVVYNGTSVILYLDGGVDDINNTSGAMQTTNTSMVLGSGETTTGDSGDLLTGILDEVRILSTALSANWISTEYNNQSSPSTFWTTGSTQSVVTNVTVTPATQTTTFALQSTTITGGALISAGTQVLTFSSFSPTITGNALITPDVLSTTFSTITPTISGDSIFTATAQSATFSTISPTITGNALITPNTLNTTFSVISPTVLANDVVFSVNTQVAVFSTISPAIITDQIFSVNTLSATFSIVTPTIIEKVIASANAQEVTFSVIAPTIKTDQIFSVNTQSATFSLISLAVTTQTKTVVSALTVSASLESPTIITDQLLVVNAQVLSMNLVTPDHIGGTWTKVPRSDDGSAWTKVLRSDDGSAWTKIARTK